MSQNTIAGAKNSVRVDGVASLAIGNALVGGTESVVSTVADGGVVTSNLVGGSVNVVSTTGVGGRANDNALLGGDHSQLTVDTGYAFSNTINGGRQAQVTVGGGHANFNAVLGSLQSTVSADAGLFADANGFLAGAMNTAAATTATTSRNILLGGTMNTVSVRKTV